MCEATGRNSGAWDRFVVTIALLNEVKYASWTKTTGGPYRCSPAYQESLDAIEGQEVWLEPLVELIVSEPDSWQAVLALARLGESGDRRPLATFQTAQQSDIPIARKAAEVALARLAPAQTEDSPE